jgi:hypothetical protein
VEHDQEDQVSDTERLARAIILFYKGGPWSPEDTQRWIELTNAPSVTTKELCNLARRVLGELQ